jgi:hypothetical protein
VLTRFRYLFLRLATKYTCELSLTESSLFYPNPHPNCSTYGLPVVEFPLLYLLFAFTLSTPHNTTAWLHMVFIQRNIAIGYYASLLMANEWYPQVILGYLLPTAFPILPDPCRSFLAPRPEILCF